MTTPGQPPPDPSEGTNIDEYTIDLTPFVNVQETPIQFGTTRRLQEQQEKIRGTIALLLTGILGFVLLWPFLFILLNGNWENTKEWLTIALPAITGLLGSAMGFYFGQRN